MRGLLELRQDRSQLPDHYTHQYFAVSAEPPFELKPGRGLGL